MIGLITGGTGDGKTLWAVTEILHDWYKANRAANALVPGTEEVPCDGNDPEYIAAKARNKQWEPLRDFRSNIKGVRIPGVTILPLDKDWRQYRDGTVCVYDESHKKGWFRTTGRQGLSEDDVITEMDEHRHRGFDLWLITQFPTKIHHEIRQLVKRHVHLVRSNGMQRSLVYEWQHAVNNPGEDEKVIAMDGEIWEFRSKGFAWYDSSSMHTHKLVVPKAVKRALIGVPIMLGLLFGIYKLTIAPALAKASGEGRAHVAASGGGSALARPAAAAPPQGDAAGSRFRPGMEWQGAATLPKMRGCAVLSKSCRCWNGEGAQMDLEQDKCRALAVNLPIDLGGGMSSPAPAAPVAPAPPPAFLGGFGGGSSRPRIGDVNPGVLAASGGPSGPR